ncbi:MAG: hypothetical protein JW995_05875 [Melioribacteraceae bacterium]|nr:hypothetical protein [Melioribacteraceae bacterium]
MNRVVYTIFILSLFLIEYSTLYSQIEAGGFLEIQNLHDFSDKKNNTMKIGQLELQISAALSRLILIDASAAYNNEKNKFELGGAEINFNLDDYLFENYYANETTSVSAGLFDIPFGIDYRYVASPDRKFVTLPLIVEQTVNNQTGLGSKINYSNGFISTDLFGVLDFSGSIVLGARTGLNYSDELEFGASALMGMDKKNSVNTKMYGADIEWNSNLIDLRDEFIVTNNLSESLILQLSGEDIYGYYLQIRKTLDDVPVFISFRYGYAKINDTSIEVSDNLYRITGCAGYFFKHNIEVKIEYLRQYKNGKNCCDNLTAQLVITF